MHESVKKGDTEVTLLITTLKDTLGDSVLLAVQFWSQKRVRHITRLKLHPVKATTRTLTHRTP